jgi:hypothetical protein
VIVTLLVEGVQGAFEIVQRSTYVPGVDGVNTAAGFAVLSNWLPLKSGPLNTLQAPVPTAGVLAARVAEPS